MKKLILNFFIGLTYAVFLLSTAFPVGQDKAVMDANNPLADMTAINLHNYYFPSFTNAPEGMKANQTWLRMAKPFANGKLLARFSLPLVTNSVGTNPNGSFETKSGLGDASLFVTYNFMTGPISVGAGPMIGFPTGGKTLGTQKWTGGLVAVFFNSKNPKFQYGSLLTWQESFAGSSLKEDVSNFAFQPIALLQIGQGFYLRSVPIWVFNLKNGDYNIPVGLGCRKSCKNRKGCI
ncbi:MAG: hypothetical protein ACK5MD_06735 [Flavobacteriales bacterium]